MGSGSGSGSGSEQRAGEPATDRRRRRAFSWWSLRTARPVANHVPRANGPYGRDWGGPMRRDKTRHARSFPSPAGHTRSLPTATLLLLLLLLHKDCTPGVRYAMDAPHAHMYTCTYVHTAYTPRPHPAPLPLQPWARLPACPLLCVRGRGRVCVPVARLHACHSPLP